MSFYIGSKPVTEAEFADAIRQAATKPWIVKVWYLGLHDEIASVSVKHATEKEARAHAEQCTKQYGCWHDDEGRIIGVPLNRVLQVRIDQL